MTAQISDSFIYKGEHYALIGLDDFDLISPYQFGMEPEMMHTACYRGFYAEFELTDEALCLRTLVLREKNNNYLPIDGVPPSIEGGHAEYHGLNVVVPYTGRIRLAKDMIGGLYIHMGYQKATAFKTVLDLTLESGRIIRVDDRSEEMGRKRGAFKDSYEHRGGMEPIAEAFSLNMDLE